MPDADIALAKKRLARELRNSVIVQFIAFFVAILGIGSIQSVPKSDIILGLCQGIASNGIMFSSSFALLGCYRLFGTVFLPVWIRIYGLGGWFFVLIAFVSLILFCQNDFVASIFRPLLGFLWFAFSLYCLIPQFFISRWLAKAAEEES
jgi:hypothetical protein